MYIFCPYLILIMMKKVRNIIGDTILKTIMSLKENMPLTHMILKYVSKNSNKWYKVCTSITLVLCWMSSTIILIKQKILGSNSLSLIIIIVKMLTAIFQMAPVLEMKQPVNEP